MLCKHITHHTANLFHLICAQTQKYWETETGVSLRQEDFIYDSVRKPRTEKTST